MSGATSQVVANLLAEEEDAEDFGDVDLSSITLEDILREEELASSASATASSTSSSPVKATPSWKKTSSPDDLDADLFFSPATVTTTLTPLPGMEIVSTSASASANGAVVDPSSASSATPASTRRPSASTGPASDAIAASGKALRTVLEIAEAREKQLLSCVGVELISPLQVKRRLRANARIRNLNKLRNGSPAKTPQQQQHQTPGRKTNAPGAGGTKTKSTGVVKVEAMESISRQLRKNIEFKEFGPGSPTVVAIHSKFIAIGTSKGLVIVFDHFQNVRQVLGNTNDNDGDGPVTAIDVSPGNDFLVCGYQSGRLVLWDMIKGTSLKAVSDAHDSAVVSVRFLKDQKPVLVSVDTNGIVNKVNFSKMMGMVYVVDVDPLYDGSAGKILSISVLPQSAGNAKVSYITDQYCLAALSSEKVTFIVAIEPEVKILYRWLRPEDIGADDPVLPSLAFAWISFPGSTRALAPVLCRAWGKQVQFLEAVFPGGTAHNHARHGWPSFEEHDRIQCDNDIMAVQWLGDQVVVYLTAQDEISVYDVMSRQELEVVDVSSLELVFASYKGKNARSFSNSFRGCDNILYLLGLKELETARVQPWTQRIDTLVDEGEWLEALALALDHFEGLKAAAAERAERDRFPPVFFRDRQNDQCLVDIMHMSQTNQRTGEKEDVFRHEDGTEEIRWCCGDQPYAADVAKRLEEAYQKGRSGQLTKNFVPISISERVADLLMEYVRLAIANAPSASTSASSSVSSSLAKGGVKLDLSKSHFQMLAGVCIEYCAIIGRTDLLFGEIFKRFKECKMSDIFVELLEPYILSERLQSLSPEAMQEFVSHYSRKNKLPQVEQCLLHLKVRELDMDTIIKICHEHELYSALTYIYNEGLEDYTTPIDVLLEACSSAPPKPKESPKPIVRTGSSGPASGSKVSALASAFGGSARTITRTVSQTPPEDPATEAARRRRLFGYKLLLYISYSLNGRSFPKGEPLTPPKAVKVRSQICHHLFAKEVEGKQGTYPRLVTLVELDAKAFLDLLAKVFDDPTIDFGDTKKSGPPSSRYDSALQSGTKCPQRLSMVLSLAEIIVGKNTFSSIEHGHFYMFEARLLSGGAIDPEEYATAREEMGQSTTSGVKQGTMMNKLMNFLALGPSFSSSMENIVSEEGFDKEGRQAMLVRLIQKISKQFYDQDAVLKSVLQEKMNRAAVILFQERGDVMRTIGAYLDDPDHEYRLGAYTYIHNESDRLVDEEPEGNNANATRRREIEEAVVGHAAALMDTHAYMFVTLILGQFPSLNNKVIQKFLSMGKNGARFEFLYLKYILIGYGSKTETTEEAEQVKELLDRSKLRIAEDPAVQERFVRLLCEFEPASVFSFLESHDSYKVDTCLKLCKEFGITEAEAYLLERTGDVTGALTLILHSLEQKLKILKPALRGFNTSSDLLTSGASSLGWQQQSDSIIERVKEGRDALQTMDVALTMCQRNSQRNRDEQAEKLWFALLDKLLRIQNAVKRAINAKAGSRIATRSGGSASQTAFQVALNELIRIVLERMASSVSLKSILFKITNEYGRGEFGDFRPTIFGMLDTYNYEQNIYQTANGLISVDLFDQVTMLRRAKTRCYAPPSNTCHYCQVLLAKPPFGMAHSSGAGGERWNVHTSMVMVIGGHTFHESCGKIWQQEEDSSSSRKKSPSPRRPSTAEKSEKPEPEDEISTRLQKRQPSTRRYLNRLRNARRSTRRTVSLHVVLESLIREDNGRNKYLRSNRSVFSLKPDPEQTSKVKKRVGSRKPASLPVNASQKGSI